MKSYQKAEMELKEAKDQLSRLEARISTGEATEVEEISLNLRKQNVSKAQKKLDMLQPQRDFEKEGIRLKLEQLTAKYEFEKKKLEAQLGQS